MSSSKRRLFAVLAFLLLLTSCKCIFWSDAQDTEAILNSIKKDYHAILEKDQARQAKLDKLQRENIALKTEIIQLRAKRQDTSSSGGMLWAISRLAGTAVARKGLNIGWNLLNDIMGYEFVGFEQYPFLLEEEEGGFMK